MSEIMTTAWSAAMVAAIAEQPDAQAPVIDPAWVKPVLPGMDLWDLWPIQTPDGATATVDGGALFLVLSAPIMGDPEKRHAHARIRLMHHGIAGWRDLGVLLPDGHTPGSREWAGSAVLDENGQLTVYFTAAGRRGEPVITFAQRVYETNCRLTIDKRRIELTQWSAPRECFAPDGIVYTREMTGGGLIGTIKAFRDPGYFRDPADAREYLLFTGSLAASASPWNGAIGLARRDADRKWAPLPPLITADGVNNELERPHMLVRDGLYYVFWSTQRKVFAANGPSGPTGLYGMAADRIEGPWRPLNETGLVLANPAAAPFQAFSWLVMADLGIVSFTDIVGLDRAPQDAAEARAHFGGTPAPKLQLAVKGDRAWIDR